MPFLFVLASMPPAAYATSCAGNNSFLGSVEHFRDKESVRAVRVKAVREKRGLDSEERIYLQILDFLDTKAGGKQGDRVSAPGIIGYDLNVAHGIPDANSYPAPFPEASEWILLVHIRGPSAHDRYQYSTLACGSILRLEGEDVWGFIEGPSRRQPAAREANQRMNLSDLVDHIAELLKDGPSSASLPFQALQHVHWHLGDFRETIPLGKGTCAG